MEGPQLAERKGKPKSSRPGGFSIGRDYGGYRSEAEVVGGESWLFSWLVDGGLGCLMWFVRGRFKERKRVAEENRRVR